MRRPVLAVITTGIVVVGAVAVYERAASPQSAAQAGVYVGLSDQRLPVKLAVSEDRVTSLDIRWLARCGRRHRGVGATSIERTIRPAAVKIADGGTFSWRGTSVERGHDGDEERQRLRLRGRHAADGRLSGTWRAERDFFNGQLGAVDRRCSTGDVRFDVRIGGSLRQPAPTTDAAGNRVVALDITADSVAATAKTVWVLSNSRTSEDSYRRTVSEVNPTTGRVRKLKTLPGGGVDEIPFAAGSGAAWVGTYRSSTSPNGQIRTVGTLLRVDARTRRVTAVPPHPRWSGTIRAVAVGAGAVWLLADRTSIAADGTWQAVLRVDPRSSRVVDAVALSPDRRTRATARCRAGNDTAELLAAGAGAVWVISTASYGCEAPQPGTRQRRQDRIGRSIRLRQIDARGVRVTRTIRLRHSYTKLAVAANAVWATTCSLRFPVPGCDRTARHALHQISLRNGAPAAVTPLSGGEIVAGLAASRDAVWISQTDKDGRSGALRRLDRTNGRLSTILRLEGAPSNVSVGGDGVWLVDTFARTLIGVPD